jgi:predicted MFS family arabinose efflux permease
MALNSAVQSGGAAAANLIGGWLITRDDSGRLLGYPQVGWVACFFFALTLVLAHRLREATRAQARAQALGAALG